VNAGVVGCSSYQGLMRFREEAAPYAPDVVLFSFVWNDAARAIDVPDEDFARSGFMGAIDHRTLFVRRVLLSTGCSSLRDEGHQELAELAATWLARPLGLE
jgi:hypothetical protein